MEYTVATSFCEMIGCTNYEVIQNLETFSSRFSEREVFYNYVDGEEGDTSKYEYYQGNDLICYIENLGGDSYDYDFTDFGSRVLFDAYVEALKDFLTINSEVCYEKLKRRN